VRTRPADWIFALAWIAAIVPAIVYLRHLQWPCDIDGVRELAIAEAIVRGHWLSDPIYAGEAPWYPPLVAASVALTSVAAHVEMSRAYVLAGLWLNGLIPLVYFLFVRRVLGSAGALAATVFFLFLPAHPQMWAGGTYSPWVFPGITAQVPFFASMLVWAHALERPGTPWLLAAGVLLGITFLSHGAPALVLAGVVAFTTLATVLWPVGEVSPLSRIKGMLTVAGTSFVVSLPFLLPIWMRYRFHVINRRPATWIDPEGQPAALLQAALSWPALPHWVLAAAGVWWVRRHVSATGQRLLLAWPVALAVGYALSVASQTIEAMPALAPAYHFTYLVRSFEATLAGCGIMGAAELATGQLRRWRIEIPTTVAAVIASVALAAALYPQYLRREAFERAGNFSAGTQGTPELEMYRWIRAHVAPGAVILAAERDALGVVAPAGRSVISVDQLFANPYVDPVVRGQALNRMLEALAAGDRQRFAADAGPYRVTHVLARGNEADAIAERNSMMLTPLVRFDTMTLFAVHAPAQ